jgi:hypothetical protein
VTRFGGWTAGLCFALAALGCGKTDSVPSAPEVDAPGTEPRLVPWQLETEGSEPLVVGIFDSEQKQPCQFLPDIEGQLRCLPLAPGPLERTSAFADPECSRPIYRATLQGAEALRAATLEPIALAEKPDGCEQRYTVARLSELGADAPHYVMFNGESCGQSALGPPTYLADQVVDFARDDIFDPAELVSGEVVPGALLGERIRLHEVEAADGSRFQHALSDEHWQKPCQLSELRGSLACMPDSIRDTTNFHVDMACEGESLWYAEACSDPAFIGLYDELYALGPTWEDTAFESSKTCRESAFSPDSGARLYQRGEELGEDALAAAEWFQAGTVRLELRGLRGEDEQLIVLSNWLFGDSVLLYDQPSTTAGPRYLDRETGVECAPVWTSDGEVRCVPSTVQLEPFTYQMYVDASCSKPAFLCASQEPCTGTDLIVWGSDSNGRKRALSRNAAVAVAGESVYGLMNDECVSSPYSGTNLFESGEVLPWDDYPLLSEVNGG